jgi:hypothetical protein
VRCELAELQEYPQAEASDEAIIKKVASLSVTTLVFLAIHAGLI